MAKITKAKGGSVVGLKASNKRVGPVDPKGAWTAVQKRTLAGAKGTAPLKKDKKLGATRMTADGGIKIKKGTGVKRNPMFQLQLEKLKNERQMQRYRMDEKKKAEESRMPKGIEVKAKDGKWIQKAINPKHKGYCTPMTKKTCTPKRKALAMTLKKMAKARKGK